jgi:hypothetical protein
MKKAVMLSTTATLMFFLSGCIPSGGRCFPYMQDAGYFCYKEHNFGRNVTPEYKKGVKDGCTTGEGRFRRDYSLSRISADYRSGWDVGRAHCKLIVPEEAKPGMRTQYQQSMDMNKTPSHL